VPSKTDPFGPTGPAHLLRDDKPLRLAARWIWLEEDVKAFDSVVAAFSTFRLGRGRGPVRVRVACSGDYELWIDGRWIGRGPTPSSLGHVFVDEHVVKGLRRGKTHRIVLLGHNDGHGNHYRPERVGGLLCQVETGDGSILAATDEAWQVGRVRAYDRLARRLYFPIGFAEYVDLAGKPDRLPTEPAKCVDRVERAFVVKKLAREKLLPREIPPLVREACPATATVSTERAYVPRGITSVSFDRRPRGATEWRGTARTAVYVSVEEHPVTVEFRCDDTFRLKVNGELVLQQGTTDSFSWWKGPGGRRRGPMHGGQGRFERTVAVTLKRGWNPIQVQVEGCERSWGFMMRPIDWGGRTLDFPTSASRDFDKPGWDVIVRAKGGGRQTVRSHECCTPHADGSALSDWQIGYSPVPGGSVRWPIVLQPGHSTIVDLGRVRVGFTDLDVTGPAGAVVDLRYSEAFNDLGRLETGGMIRYGDRLRLRKGRQPWRSIGRRGWRYVRVTLRESAEPVKLHKLGTVQTSALGEPEGRFRCSDPMLDAIFDVSAHTLRMDTQEHYLDCPTREWGQYAGDARAEALQNYTMFADTSVSRKGLRQFARVQDPSGFFSSLVPAVTYHRLPDYCFTWLTWLVEHFQHTGDRVLAEELYPAAEAVMAWFEHLLNRHGLLESPDDYNWWVFLSHTPLDKRGEITGFNGFYMRACRDLAYLCRCLGYADRARHWRERAGRVGRAMHKRLWSGAHRLFADCRYRGRLSSNITQANNVLAVWSGAASGRAGRAVMQRLIHPDGTSRIPVEMNENGFFKSYTLGALYDVGLGDTALALMRRYWGAMIDAGCTTWRELFSPDGPRVKISSTYCHAYAGAPGYFLPAYVLGVRPAQPGYDAILVDPHLGDLTCAEGDVPTPHGIVSIRWQRKRNTWQGQLVLPNGIAEPRLAVRSPSLKLDVRHR